MGLLALQSNTGILQPRVGLLSRIPFTPVLAKSNQRTSKFAQYQQEAEQAQQVAQKENSFGGLLKNTLLSIPKETAKVAADIVRAPARGVLSTALTVAPKSVQQNIGQINPEEDFGKVGKYALGDEPIKTIPNTGRSTLQGFGVKNEGLLSKLALPVGVGLTALDVYPGGGAEKKGAKGLIKAGEEIAKEEAIVGSKRILSAEKKSLLSSPKAISEQLPSKQGILKQGENIIQDQSKGLLQHSSYDKNLPQEFNPDKYIKEQVAKREGARVQGNPNIIGKIKTTLSDIKTKLVDFSAPIEDTLNEAVKINKIKLLPEQDIHNQIDRVLRSPTLAGQFAKDNGIVDVIRKVDDLDAFDQYLTAKHAIELDTRGIATGRDLTKDQLLVRSLAPKYETDAKIISNYSQKLLDYSVDTGLISKELADTLKARYPDYVPFQRVFNELEKTQSQGVGGIASLSRQSVVQKIEGSERAIESPVQSLLAKTNDAFKQGEKNLAGKMLAGYEKLPDNPFQLRELQTGESAKNTFSFLDNGVKRTFETTPEIAQAAKSLNVQQLNILGKILAFPVRVARLGITGINLPFVGANIAKDQVTAFINSEQGLKTSVANPVNFLRSLFSAVKHDALYEEMVRAGGAGTSFDISRNQAETTLESIRAGRNLATKILYTVRHPSELLRAVENIIGRGEELTRIQQYRGIKQGLLAKGMNEKNAIIAGARAARDNTVNFARRGEWGTVLNSAFLYLNASIQGTRTLLRNLKNKPVQTGIKIAISTLFPVAVATSWNLSDPERKKVYEDIAEYEKENNIIIIPPNPTKDESGKWNVIKIPLSQEINNLVGLVRRPIESAAGLDPVKFGDFAKAIVGTISPINPTKGSVLSTLTPQAIKPTLEGAMNKNLFTGYPQVPQRLEKFSPEKQIKPSTSQFAVTLGQKLGVSPIKIDAFIKGTFGGVGQQITGQQNVIDAVFARFGKASGGEIENKFYEAEKLADQKKVDERAIFKENTYQKVQDLIDQGSKEEAQKIVDNLSDADYEIYKNIKTGERAKRTEELRTLLKRNPADAVKFVRSQNEEEANRLINLLTDKEYTLYEKGKGNYSVDAGKNPGFLTEALVAKKVVDKFILPRIIGKETTWANNIAEETKKTFPFAPKALADLSGVNAKELMFGGGKKGTYKKSGADIYDVLNKVLPEKWASKIAENTAFLDKPSLVLEKDLELPMQKIAAHEMLHRLFDLSPYGMDSPKDKTKIAVMEKFGGNWIYEWDSLVDKYPKLKEIDGILKERYGINNEDSPTYSEATERFAWLGMEAMDGGIKVIPPELRKYYIGIIKGAEIKNNQKISSPGLIGGQ